MAIINPFKNHIGLDISDLKIRFFQSHFSPRLKTAKVQAAGEISVPMGHILDGEIKMVREVTQLIKQCVNKPLFGKARSTYVNASLPEKKTFIKLITIPRVPDEELLGAIKWGIEQNIPVMIDQVYFDWQIINTSSPSNKEKMDVLVSVAPKQLVDQYLQCIEGADLFVIGMENESIAIARCLLNYDSSDTLSVIVDIGKSRTTIMLYTRGTIQFSSSLEVNGNQMTHTIAHQLHLSWQDAEKAKLICGLDKRKGKGIIRKILEPQLARLITTINETVGYADEYLSLPHRTTTIYLTGSVSEMVGLSEYIQQTLHISTVVGQSERQLRHNQKNHQKLPDLHSYTTAIGLSLKHFG